MTPTCGICIAFYEDGVVVQGISSDPKPQASESISGLVVHPISPVVVQPISSAPKPQFLEPISGDNEPKTNPESQEPIDAPTEKR